MGGEIEALFVRAADMPEFVADGAADGGITGWDLVEESGRRLQFRLDLGCGHCALVVAAKEDSGILSLSDVAPGSRVATSFPRGTADFFRAAGVSVEVVPVGGAAEIAPHQGIADIIVDLTSSGSTLKTNGLQPIATVRESSARFVTVEAPESRTDRALQNLADVLKSVVAARSSRYAMANVPQPRWAVFATCCQGCGDPRWWTS
ncbi:MAG TPA: ATP phosphoribosyltransferase [Gemmatimonadaceae bacterium]